MGDIGEYWREHKEYVKSKQHENDVDDFEIGEAVTYMPWAAKGNHKHSSCQRGTVVRKGATVLYVQFKDGEPAEAVQPTQLA
jgi:hypothetical protein